MRRFIFHRSVCLLLIVCLCCAMLTGCSKPAETDNAGAAASDSTGTPPAGSVTVSQNDINQPLVWLSERCSTGFEEAVLDMENFVAAGERLWSVGTARQLQEDGAKYLLLSLAQNGSDPACVPLQLPDFPTTGGFGERVTEHLALAADPQGALYSLDLCSLFGDRGDPYDDVYFYFLTAVDSSGQCGEPRLLNLPEDTLAVSEDGVNACLLENALYLPTLDGLWRIPAEGEAQIVSCAENFLFSALTPLPDGGLLAAGVILHGDGSPSFSTGYISLLEAATQQFGSLITLPDGLYHYNNMRAAAGPDGAPYLWNTDGIYRLDVQNGSAKPICRWLDSGMDGYALLQVLPLADGTFLAVSQEETGSLPEIFLLREADPEQLANRTVVTLALTEGGEELEKAILAFNRSHDDIFVQTVDYRYDDYTELTPLDKAVIDHTVPDIVEIPTGKSYQSYLRKGLFCDLYPLIDGDAELSREDILPCVLNTCTVDDMLPTVLLTYDIFTLAAPAALVGDQPGWDFAQLEEAVRQNPVDRPIFSEQRDLLLLYMTIFGGRDLVDYTTGTCHLDSSYFVHILEHCAAYPETRPNLYEEGNTARERFARGEGLACFSRIANFSDLRNDIFTFDGPVTYIGVPGEDGGCGSALMPRLQMGITADCQNPEAAWQFLRTLLLPDGQRQLCGMADSVFDQVLPARQDIFAEMAAAAQKPQDHAFALPYPFGVTDLELLNRPLTDAEVGKLWQLVQDTEVLYLYDNTIRDILTEEAAYFYSGVRSAEETAAIIQNRVQTYLAEQS